MFSFWWMLINSKPLRIPSRFTYIILVLCSVLFSIPRIGEVWGVYSIIVSPILMIALLEILKQMVSFLSRIKNTGSILIENGKQKEHFETWWGNLNKTNHFAFPFVIALFLGFISLLYNRNPLWSRYTDALGIFYLGLAVGEIAYLLLLVPTSLLQLKNYRLRLNPLNPANTTSLKTLADTIFALALSISLTLLALNALVATAAYIFRHIQFGVTLISAMAWIVFLALAVLPHFILWQISEAKKQETMQELENKLELLYENFSKSGEGYSSIDEIIKLQNQVLSSKSFPVSNSSLFGIVTTLLLNMLPFVMNFINR